MFPHSPGRAFDVEDDGSVHESVQDGGGHDGVTEDLAPFGQAPVGGDDRRVADLVAAVDDLEEGGRLGSSHRDQPDVVDDEDRWCDVGLEFVVEGALDEGVAEVADQSRRRR